MNNDTERWMPIPDTDGHYLVSSLGRVKSVARTITTSSGRPYSVRGRILKQYQNKDGYWMVSLRMNGKWGAFRVHRMMLTCFVRPPVDGEVTRHLNGNPADNRLDNLTWGTQRENMRDRVTHGTDPDAVKTHCSWGHLLERPNLVESKYRAGRRNCKACNRARAHVWRRPHLAGEFQAVADSYYREIMH